MEIRKSFVDTWKHLWSFRDRVRSRRSLKPRILAEAERGNPEALIAETRKQVQLWAKIKEFANHKEAFEWAVQDEMVMAINQLFSPTTLQHEVNFHRGCIYMFLMVSQKTDRADLELIKAQSDLARLEKEYVYVSET